MLCLLPRHRGFRAFSSQPILSVIYTCHSRSFSMADQFKIATEFKKQQQTNLRPLFRTSERNPMNHNINHEGLFYTIPENDVKRLFQKGLGVDFQKMCTTFQETSLMVRRPALEIFDYIKTLNYNHPVLRLLLSSYWKNHWKEISMSTFKVGRVDLPNESVNWLKQFQLQNNLLIKNLVSSENYTWSKRESAEKGTPILQLIEFGLSRPRYASDIVGIILKETKKWAKDRKFKVLVAVHGVNGLWGNTSIKSENKEIIPTDNVSIVHNFRKMLKNDWNNGMVVCSIDERVNFLDKRESYMPYYLLEKKAFELFDPFIPVLIPEYNNKELYSCLEYYIDRMWIQNPKGHTDEGKKELAFLSCRNPYQLTRVCAPW